MDNTADKMNEIEVAELPIDQLIPYKKHPFKPDTGDIFNGLVESIKNIGLTHAISVIPSDESGKYEILSGHRRTAAYKELGYPTISTKIYKGLSEYEISDIVIDTNQFQRSFKDWLPSEKAQTIALRYSMMKKQGKRNDLVKEIDDSLDNLNNSSDNDTNVTSEEIPQKSERKKKGATTREELAVKFGVDVDSITDFIRINEHLIPELINRMDNREIKREPAVYISFISKNEQAALNEIQVMYQNCCLR